MKNTIITSLLVIVFFTESFVSNAQHNVIKLDAIGLLYPGLTVFRASYERNFGKYISLTLNFETGKYSSGTTQTGSKIEEIYSLKGWGLMPEFRVYPFSERKDAPMGFFFGTHLRYRKLREKYTGKDYTINNGIGSNSPNVNIINRGSLTEIGLHIGYKGKIRQFIFEPLIGFGPGFVSGFSPADRVKIDPFHGEDINFFFNLLRVQFSVGFVFPKI